MCTLKRSLSWRFLWLHVCVTFSVCFGFFLIVSRRESIANSRFSISKFPANLSRNINSLELQIYLVCCILSFGVYRQHNYLNNQQIYILMTAIQNFIYFQTRFLQNPPFPSLCMLINSWPSFFLYYWFLLVKLNWCQNIGKYRFL